MCKSERPGSQSKYCRQKFCEQGLSEQPFAKMAHILAGKDLGTSFETQGWLDRRGPGTLVKGGPVGTVGLVSVCFFPDAAKSL